MDALPSVTDEQADQEEYFLDLDAGADAGLEDFDFKLDGTYDDETQGAGAETDAGSAAKAATEFEIVYEDDEAATTRTGDAEDDVNQSLSAEYQDEIGYEDEEPEKNADVAGSAASKSGSPNTGQESALHDQEEPQVLDDPVLNDGFDEPDREDVSAAFDVAADALDDTTDGTSTHQSQADNAQTPASRLADLQGTPADVSSASPASSVPEIVVHYNQGRYSLIGAPSDDPDSYFFSDTKDLDGSLSQLLSSIRDVISDEVSPEDELVVRIDALDLEFGEKSSHKFLGRSFYEILRCFSALLCDSEHEGQELELDLVIRRDCETRFIELLEEAGVADEPVDHSTGFEGAEDDVLDPEDVSIDDFHEDFQTGEGLADTTTLTTRDDLSVAAEQDREVITLQAAPQNGEETVGTSIDVQTNQSGTDTTGLMQFGASNENLFEEEYLETHPEPTNEMTGTEMSEGYELEDVDAVDDLDEAFAADDIFDEQELAIDMAEQSVIEQGADNWSGELSGQAGISTGEVSSAGEVGVTAILDPTLHGNDAASSFDTGSALAAIHEEAVETFESHGMQPVGSGLSMDSAVPGEVPVVDTQEVGSRYTSRTSTINGDEAGREDYGGTGHMLSAKSSEQPQTPADEIDWENDGEGDGDEDVAAPTPSGKRSRTNETEGLSDGTDNKRRRT